MIRIKKKNQLYQKYDQIVNRLHARRKARLKGLYGSDEYSRAYGRVARTTIAGKIHCCMGKPAVFSTGSKHPYSTCAYNNKSHKVHGPSEMSTYWVPNGDGVSFSWNMYGLRHRLDGSTKHERGGLKDRWYIYGIDFTKAYNEYI